MKVRSNMRGGGRINRRGRPGFFGSPRGGAGGGMNQGGGGRFGGPGGFHGGGGAGGGGKIPFDLVFCEDIYPRVQPSTDDQVVAAALLKRNTDLTPSTEELQNVQNLVTRVQGILEGLILTPGTFDSCQVDEVRQVGSFKQGTILAGHKTADFVVILKTLPTKESVEALCNKVSEIIQQTECVRTSVTNRGFEISNVQQATIRILITVVPQNFRKLDPELHLESKVLNEHWQAIRHSRWFEENVSSNSTIKVLIRIMRDIRQRFEAFLPLNTWMIDLLVHFCTMNNPQRSALPVNVAFKRIFSLMSSGIFLPGYSGATGSIPSGRGHYNQHHNYRLLTYEEQDLITATAQTLLRILSHGGLNIILGLEKTDKDIINSPSIWNGVLVVPSEKAYDKPLLGQTEEEELFEEYIDDENENDNENSHEDQTGEQMDSSHDHDEESAEGSQIEANNTTT